MLKKKVLIIDDSMVVRGQVVPALRGAGYDVLEACDGLEGLAQVRATPDLALVLCDQNMPGMTGIDVLAALQLEQLPLCPVVMLTSEARPELLVRARALGAKAWIIKPVLIDRLLAVVHKLLN